MGRAPAWYGWDMSDADAGVAVHLLNEWANAHESGDVEDNMRSLFRQTRRFLERLGEVDRPRDLVNPPFPPSR
jgi:hypothetical protein